MICLKQTMWLFVSFDLPTKTPSEKGRATRFRNLLIKKGFSMFQFSLYSRHCGYSSFADVIERFVKGIVPPGGKVEIIRITDLQFGNIELFFNGRRVKQIQNKEKYEQLKIF